MSLLAIGISSISKTIPVILKKEDNYIAALNNLLIVQIEMEKYDDAMGTIKKVRERVTILAVNIGSLKSLPNSICLGISITMGERHFCNGE